MYASEVPQGVLDPGVVREFRRLGEKMGRSIFGSLARALEESVSTAMERMELAREGGGEEEVSGVVHSLKGTVLQVGANGLAGRILELEARVSCARGYEDYADLLPDLWRELELVHAELCALHSQRVTPSRRPGTSSMRELGHATLTRESGVILAKLSAGRHYTQGLVFELLEGGQGLTAGEPLPWLLDVRGLCSMTREACASLLAAESVQSISELAVLVGSSVSRAMGDYLVAQPEPPYSLQVFTTESEAFRWLRGGG